VTGAVRFSDGRIAVANGRTFQVQVFDPTGRAVASFGRQGDGPGEFAELRYICRMRGDTLIASDGGRTHVVFAPDGSYVREVQPDLAPTRTVRQMAELQGCSPDGSFLLMRDGFVRNNTRTTRWDDSSFAYLYNPDGRLRASIGPLAGMTWDHAAGLQQPVMFGAMERHTFDGRYLYSAPATDFSIQLYDLNGRLARIVRRPWTPLTVTAGEIRTYKEYRREAFSGYSPDERREYEQMIEVLEIAPSHPAVQLLLVDARGNLWVREGAPWSRVDTARFRRGGRWSVFDPTGRWLGSVQIPDTITIVSIDSDVIIGTVVDAMGLEYLVTHRLIRP
jgi:hypothetical protein